MKNLFHLFIFAFSLLPILLPSVFATFSGEFAPNDWTISLNNNDGSVDTSQEPNSVIIYSPTTSGATYYSVIPTMSYFVTFDYSCKSNGTHGNIFCVSTSFMDCNVATIQCGPTVVTGVISLTVHGGVGMLLDQQNNAGGLIATTITNFVAIPVSSAPSLVPTAVPTVFPTAVPTAQVYPNVQVLLGIKFINGTTATPPSNYSRIIQTTLSGLTGLNPMDVEVTNPPQVKSVGPGNYAYIYNSILVYNPINYPAVNGSASKLTMNVERSISFQFHEGYVEQLLRSNAMILDSPSFAQITVSNYSFAYITFDTEGSSSSSTSTARLSNGKVAGIVVGVIVGTFLLLLILFCCLKHKRSQEKNLKGRVSEDTNSAYEVNSSREVHSSQVLALHPVEPATNV